MRELALFAGAGGGILGGYLLGWKTVCAVEIEEYPRKVLLARQRDGILDHFPIWDDIRTFDGAEWRGRCDIITGGFPCQDISAAGKGGGLAGARSGLWFEMLRVIDEARPRFVFAENSPFLRTRGLGTVIEGLASLGYDARWCVLGAGHVGGPHLRKRLWLVAYTKQNGERRQTETRFSSPTPQISQRMVERSSWWCDENLEGSHELVPKPLLDRVGDDVANRLDRLAATGNGQVPLVAATAFNILSEGLI